MHDLNFSQFIKKIFDSFFIVFDNIIGYINIIIDNYFIKLIIYFILCFFIINFLFILYKLLSNLLKQKNLENKKSKGNDIE